MKENLVRHSLSRRRLLMRWAFVVSAGAGTALLHACGGPAQPAAKPTEVPKPPAAPPTLQATVAVATAAPTAAPPTPTAAAAVTKPAEPTKPAAAPAEPTKPAPAAVKPGQMRPPEPNPKRGGVLRIASGTSTAPHFDLHQGAPAHVLTHLYNNLIRKDLTDGLRTIIPDLAERWETSSDGKAITFYLRDGVKFHDGTPFSAQDVAATFNRIVKPPAGITSTLRSQLDMLDSVEVVNERTARFILSRPSPTILEILTGPAMIVYSKKSLDANNNDLRKEPAPGTGAFMWKDHKPAEKWTFVRNPNYWDPVLPYVDQLELLHTPQLTDRGSAVLANQADMTWNASVDTWREAEKRKDITSVALIPNFGAHTAHMNNTRKPLDDKRVRRAIHLAVSRQNIFKAYQDQEPIFLGRWMGYASPYSPKLEEIAKLPGYRADKTEDIAEAKKLMAEAGYKDGFGPIEILSATAPWAAEIMAPVFAEELKRTLGITTKIRLIERGLLIEEYKNGSFDILVETQFFSPIADPTPAWNQYLRTGGSQNWSRYSNPEFDKLLDQINTETDPAKRKELFDKGMAMLDQDVPFFVTGFTAHSPIWRNYVKGLSLDKRIYVEWGRVETAWLDK